MPHLGMGELVIVAILVGVAAGCAISLVARAVRSGGARRQRSGAPAAIDEAPAVPITAIGDVRDGARVRIVGAVEGSAGAVDLRAPLSGAYGVAYRSVVWPVARLPGDDTAPLATEERANHFLLECEEYPCCAGSQGPQL